MKNIKYQLLSVGAFVIGFVSIAIIGGGSHQQTQLITNVVTA